MSTSSPSQRAPGILLRSGTNEVEFIEFTLGGTSFGINVAKVQRVIARSGSQITRADQNSKDILGMVYVQEKPILLIDLRSVLGIQPAAQNEDRELILVTRFNKKTTAFLIDGVNKIHRTSWTEYEPMSGTSIADNMGGYVTGTIKIEGRVVLILDLEHLMLEYLPAEQQAPVEVAPERKQLRQNVRIIYAEDSPVVRKLMIKTLHEGGYTQVESFPHGQAAFERLEEIREKAVAEEKSILDYVDCIITDIEMPQMDGLTLCRMVKESTGGGHIPSVVVFSSLVNQEMAQKCKAVGADAQISKPHGGEILRILDDLCLQG